MLAPPILHVLAYYNGQEHLRRLNISPKAGAELIDLRQSVAGYTISRSHALRRRMKRCIAL